MLRKPLLGAAICAASILGVGTSAFAGEVTGQDPARGTPFNSDVGHSPSVGNAVVEPSRCAASGLEDDNGGPNGGPGVTPQTPKGVGGAGVDGVAAGCGGPANGRVNR
jgi:hypothetical protein